jgi:hypothetical protein
MSNWLKLDWLTLLVFGLVFSGISCGDEEILAPNTATLVLVVNPSSIPADGASTATVEAILQDGEGNAVHGVTVFFTTTLGTITEKAETEDGIARAVLTAGIQEGTATIQAFSGALNDTAQIIIGFQNLTILLTANPTEIPADGNSTSRIDALVTEEKGIVPDGTKVFFTTSLGTIEPQAETQDGRAIATLTSGFIEGTATITSVVSNTSQTTTMAIGIPVSNITLSASPSTFEVDNAETQTHVSDITVTVWNAAFRRPMKTARSRIRSGSPSPFPREHPSRLGSPPRPDRSAPLPRSRSSTRGRSEILHLTSVGAVRTNLYRDDHP